MKVSKREQKKIILKHLEIIAENIAIRFNCPLYLVGSFISIGIDAMDIDIIMPMSEDRMMRLFKSNVFNDRWFKFILKQKEYMEEHLRDWDIDFKVQSKQKFDKIKEQRIKLTKIV